MKGSTALFLKAEGELLNRSRVYDLVVEASMLAGLHDSTSERLEDHFGPHCCQHWSVLTSSGLECEGSSSRS